MLRISDYDYPLTDERIAKYPLAQRDHSKLLIYRQGQIQEDLFYNIGKYLPPHSLLVYNNTRVIQARLVFHKPTGARIEVFCLEPLSPADYQLSLSSTQPVCWKCMVGNLKKWKEGPLTLSGECKGIAFTLTAERLETTGNTHSIRFSWDNGKLSFAEILDSLGELPIPPYLNRATEESDKTTYQTVYSKIKGSVAAPTAGLHFTDKVLDDLRKRGVRMEEVTLHVGAGTFQPVKTEDANEHEMHTEVIAVPKKTIKAILDNLGGIVAVGTTSMRTLESLYYIGLQLKDTFAHFPYEECKFEDYPWKGHRFDLKVKQFEPYTTYSNCSTEDALREILYYLKLTEQETLHAETQIMIKPGYRFRVVDALITNFHQPKSTLLLLVSAFVGEDWHKIYDYALTHDFRFLSYGDSSYLVRNNRTL